MTNETIDLLKEKIEQAKENLPEATQDAIRRVDWKAAILGLRKSRGYDFEQLGALELETELVLCGLLAPKDYPKALEDEMGIPKIVANELVEEMNKLVFKRIKEELIKNSEIKKAKLVEAENATENIGIKTLNLDPQIEEREEILKHVENPELIPAKKIIHPVFEQKITSTVNTPVVETKHAMENIPASSETKNTTTSYPKSADPYRLSPDE